MRGRTEMHLATGIVVFGLVGLAVLWSAVFIQAGHERRQTEEVLHAHSLILAQAVEDHSARTFRWADRMLEFLGRTYLDEPETFARTVRSLTEGGSTVPLQVRVTDATGLVVFADTDVPPVGVEVRDRSYFKVLRESPSQGMFVSEPVLGRLSGKPTLVAARRLERNGAFAGVVALSLDLKLFTDFYETLATAQDSAITLVGLDRQVRARAPAPAEGLVNGDGLSVVVPEDRPYLRPGAPETGSYVLPSPFDGTVRMALYKRMEDYPFVVVVSHVLDQVMAPTMAHRRVLMGFASLSTLVVVVFCAVLAWLVRRQGKANWELEASRLTLRSQTAELRRSNKELEAFAYVASHDLREPLRMVSAYLGLIERRLGGQLDPEIAEFMHFARDGAQRMDHLILDLLEYSRVGRSGRPKEKVALSDIMAGVSLTLEPALIEADAVLAVAPDLPVVQGHPDELARLFQNLIGNAVKYRAPDRQLEVSVTSIIKNGEAIVAVSDNGIGIDSQHFERIFAIFQRLHPHSGQSGTGIGLALCRKIAEHHGGRIWLTSRPDQGSTFLVALPLE